ncbi:hypothetical protein Bpfe_030502, partial [Biomphalaria pfeifferi]
VKNVSSFLNAALTLMLPNHPELRIYADFLKCLREHLRALGVVSMYSAIPRYHIYGNENSGPDFVPVLPGSALKCLVYMSLEAISTSVCAAICQYTRVPLAPLKAPRWSLVK